MGGFVGDVFDSIGDTFSSIVHNPLPVLLDIGMISMGVPPIWAGAAAGGLNAGMNGQNILQGAITGGVSGYVGGVTADALKGYANSYVTAMGAGAAAGGTNAFLNGTDILKGALTGGAVAGTIAYVAPTVVKTFRQGMTIGTEYNNGKIVYTDLNGMPTGVVPETINLSIQNFANELGVEYTPGMTVDEVAGQYTKDFFASANQDPTTVAKIASDLGLEYHDGMTIDDVINKASNTTVDPTTNAATAPNGEVVTDTPVSGTEPPVTQTPPVNTPQIADPALMNFASEHNVAYTPGMTFDDILNQYQADNVKAFADKVGVQYQNGMTWTDVNNAASQQPALSPVQPVEIPAGSSDVATVEPGPFGDVVNGVQTGANPQNTDFYGTVAAVAPNVAKPETPINQKNTTINWYAGQSPWHWGTADAVNVQGTNAGYRAGQFNPNYQWGQNAVPTLPTSAVGGTQHLDINSFINATMGPHAPSVGGTYVGPSTGAIAPATIIK